MNRKNLFLSLIPMLSLLAAPTVAQVLPVSETEQSLLGIHVQAVTAVDQGGAGEPMQGDVLV